MTGDIDPAVPAPLRDLVAASRHLAALWRRLDGTIGADVAILDTNLATALDRLAAVEPYAGIAGPDPSRSN